MESEPLVPSRFTQTHAARTPADPGGGLSVIDDPAFLRRDWFVQRIAWVVFVLLLAGATLGVRYAVLECNGDISIVPRADRTGDNPGAA
jgi:hypothetical protein